MLIKMKRTTDIICSGKGTIVCQKEESIIYSIAKIKSLHFKNEYFIPYINYLFISLLILDTFNSNKNSFFDEIVKPKEFKVFHRLSSNIYKNRNSLSNSLCIFLDICNRYLYFSKIAQFHILNIFLDYCYEINFVNIFDFFYKSKSYNSFFKILLNKIFIISLHSIKTLGEERSIEENISCIGIQKLSKQKYLFVFENSFFEPNILTTNTCKLIDDKKNKNNDIIINIKQRNKGNKFLIRNLNHLRNVIKIIKYIILLNLLKNIFVNNKFSYIGYNSYTITLKIKGIGTKKIFYSDTDYFSSNSYPNEVYINGNKQNDVTHSYNLNQTDNFIELVWYNLISSCYRMFYECSNITEIDLSNFNTSKVNEMRSMFYGCSSLTSLNLSNFDTSKVKRMNDMFGGCISLISLNLSNFDTSEVTWMNDMFYGCSSLTSLNLSNFDTSKVEKIYNLLNGCTNLEYINMLNFNESSLSSESNYYSNIFNNVPNNIVLCINKINIPTKIYEQISAITCRREDCSDDWKLHQKKIIEGTEQCFNNCPNKNPYEYNGQCVSQCPNENYNDDNNITKCKCELEKCLTCPKVALINKLCTKCNDNYYQMENFNCYNEIPTGYYLDRNDSLYKKCYYTCESCEIKGNDEFHNCLNCNNEFNFEIKINNYINCYVNCSYYYYFNNNNNNYFY